MQYLLSLSFNLNTSISIENVEKKKNLQGTFIWILFLLKGTNFFTRFKIINSETICILFNIDYKENYFL